MSKYEELLAFQLKAYKIPFEREYKFHPTRKWRVDFYFPSLSLLVEIEGGIWTGGRHTRASGYMKDMEKYNAASEMGFKLLRFSGEQVKKGAAATKIVEMNNHHLCLT